MRVGHVWLRHNFLTMGSRNDITKILSQRKDRIFAMVVVHIYTVSEMVGSNTMASHDFNEPSAHWR